MMLAINQGELYHCIHSLMLHVEYLREPGGVKSQQSFIIAQISIGNSERFWLETSSLNSFLKLQPSDGWSYYHLEAPLETDHSLPKCCMFGHLGLESRYHLT